MGTGSYLRKLPSYFSVQTHNISSLTSPWEFSNIS
jgi:hypothetical protein